MSRSYINPIEILELTDVQRGDINIALIKRARKKLFAEIELSDDGHLNYKGTSLSKSDCEKVIEELENPEKIDYYYHLSSNVNLNNLLASGSNKFFDSFRHEAIYKIPGFVDFISPYFAKRFDKSLIDAFNEGNVERLGSILRVQALLPHADLNIAFKGLTLEIQRRIDGLEELKQRISDEDSEYSVRKINADVKSLEELFPAEIINLLPAYFQSQINNIADAVYSLDVEYWNRYHNVKVSISFLKLIISLNITSIAKSKFEQDLANNQAELKKQEAQKKNAPMLKKWAAVLLSIDQQINPLESKEVKSREVFLKIQGEFSLAELNSLPSFADEIRMQIAHSIRSLSIASWNKQNDMSSALGLINLALQISVNTETASKLKKDKMELEAIELKYKGILVCYFCNVSPPESGFELKRRMYLETSRGSSYNQRTVQFSYVDLDIPRCEKCKKKHFHAKERLYWSIGLSILLGVFLGYDYRKGLNENFIYFLIGGLLIGFLSRGYYLSKLKVKDTYKGVLRRHPMIANKIKEGWSFSKPQA